MVVAQAGSANPREVQGAGDPGWRAHPRTSGTPAFEALRELAASKLPEVEALITRARAMRNWLLTATDCDCKSLDVCALFNPDDTDTRPPDPLRITHVDGLTAARL